MKGRINGVLVRCKASTLTPKTSKNGTKKMPLSLADDVGVSCHHRCSECGKMFNSNKALYGHLRCHPDRNWRGFKNPVRVVEESPWALVGPLSGNAGRFSGDELEVADALLMLAGGPGSVEVRPRAPLSPESSFNSKEELFLVREASPGAGEGCGDPVTVGGCLGPMGCSGDRTESGAATSMATGGEQEEQNVVAPLLGESLMICLATGSWEKSCTVQSGTMPRGLDLDPLPILIDGNDSSGGCSTVKALVLDLSLHL